MLGDKKRILIVSANPKTTKPLRLEEEKRNIKEGLRAALHRDDFVIETSEATTIEMFERDMVEFKPNILHFCGHGADDLGILFESECGKASFVEGKPLAEYLGKFSSHLECVVLNACYSIKQAEDICNQIKYVVGMKEAVGDSDAIIFSTSFYQAIFAHKEYDEAFEIACAALKMKKIGCADFTPKLLSHGAGASSPTSEERRARIKLYLQKLKKGCEDNLRKIKSRIYELSGDVVYSTDSKTVYGADDFDLHIPYQPIDENGEAREKTDDICDCINSDSRKIVLLGEPGSGKTVSLLKITIEFVDRALADDEALIPILVPLGSYKDKISPEEYAKKRMAIDTEYAEDIFDSKTCLFVLDALNEVATDKRDSVVKYILELPHYIVSCRLLDYKQEFAKENDLARIEILDLDILQIKSAIENEQAKDLWTAIGGNDYLISFWDNLCKDGNIDLFWKSPNTIKPSTIEAVREDSNTCDFEAWIEMHNKGLLPLCRNPMLLKMVYNIYIKYNSNLPQNRGKLFETFAEKCINSEIEKLEKKGEKNKKELNILKAKTFEMLTYLAEAIVVNRQGTGIEYCIGHQTLNCHFAPNEIDELEKFARDAGILIYDEIEYRFAHQLHQEYFASRSLQIAFEQKRSPNEFFKYDNWWETTGWEESAVILAGILSQDQLTDFLIWLSEVQPKLVIRCIENAGISTLTVDSIDQQTKDSLMKNWLYRLKREDDTPQSRIYIGQAIDKLGDPRYGVGVTKKGNEVIPEIEWIDFEGSDISMSKYPITVCQYVAFLEDNYGYKNNSWWASSFEAQEWHRLRYAIPSVSDLRNAPITNISWYDAVAFCQWLSCKYHQKIQLPFEEEWISCIKSNLPTTSVITEFELSEMADTEKFVSVGLSMEETSKKKLSDLGLVWEWCNDRFGDKQNTWGISSSDSIPTRILKGGSWRSSDDSKNSNYRLRTYATHVGIDIGFRVVKISNK